MPLDDYAAVGGGGALRLKGAKVGKTKKKKKDKKLESALARSSAGSGAEDSLPDGTGERKRSKSSKRDDDDDSGHKRGEAASDGHGDVDADESFKTDAQRRFEEAKRKKFLELSKSAASNPELLKTHKERVEELNHFLSKLSEHNDMPKIGPG
ncbi:hypothetical protein BROUX41_002170 [Berkeleyomyces rouxiae]|uniref:uncharacterized protein n=1 Tax=Berkeleyomyces rouxiae TaxID=2035830 RepID=UPI003B7B7411